jgi:hypothetical protein
VPPRLTAQPAVGGANVVLDSGLLRGSESISYTTSPTPPDGDEFSTRRPSNLVPPW